ncbi:MAG: XRE family transcriptional regulator [Thermodesulfobacteriota bacterium]
MKTFGEFIKNRLTKLGKSQKDLSKKLAVSPAYISQICRGKKNPPDLGRPKNRALLRAWANFLETPEEEILDLVRYQLHRVRPRPTARFERMRAFLLGRLRPQDKETEEQFHALELHPAENMAIRGMTEIYLLLREEPEELDALPGYSSVRFRDACTGALANRRFVEEELLRFFEERSWWWTWNPESHDVRFSSESPEIVDAVQRVRSLLDRQAQWNVGVMIPVVGHVSAGEGFEFTDGGYPVGVGFDKVELPPGMNRSLAERLYCVRVRGWSLREFFGDGTLLFIKPESWEEIKDGDLVIFKDRHEGKAFVKKVEFAGENLILKPMNPLHKNIVLKRSELMLLERVAAVVFS